MQTDVTVEQVGRWLGWLPEFWPRLHPLAAAELTGTFTLPGPQEMSETLERLVVPPQAIAEIVDVIPSPEQPEAWWLLERLHHAVVASDDGWYDPPWAAPWPTDDDPFTRHFHTYVFIAAIPHVLQVHGARGIDPEITWSALSDIGLQIANYEVRFGSPGFDGAVWVWPHFRGEVYRLGRLQYDLTYIGFDDAGVTKGEEAVAVHIPALGPLTVEGADDSFARAREFFPRHFPERSHRVVTCHSWLMDPQLAAHLPPTSNIVGFQRRFTIAPGDRRDANIDVIRYVFGEVPASIDDLPQESTVQRAIVQLIKDGGSWQQCHGWFEL